MKDAARVKAGKQQALSRKWEKAMKRRAEKATRQNAKIEAGRNN